jgi:hypothetical protein
VAKIEKPDAVVAERQTVEYWATKKKMLPRFIAGPKPPRGVAQPVLNPNYTQFGETKFGNNWPEGQEMTEAEFDAAIAKNATQLYG